MGKNVNEDKAMTKVVIANINKKNVNENKAMTKVVIATILGTLLGDLKVLRSKYCKEQSKENGVEVVHQYLGLKISRKCLDKEWKVQQKWQVKELHGVLSWRPQQRFTAPPEVDDDDVESKFLLCNNGIKVSF